MPEFRQTHREKFYSDDRDFWVEVEFIDEWQITSGQGLTFQRTTMTFNRDGNRQSSMKKIYNPDQTKFAEVPVADKVTVTSDRGLTFQRRIYELVNDESNQEREVRIDKIHSSEDHDQTIDCEVPLKFTVRSGAGLTFQKRIFELDQSDLPGIRETIG